MTAMAVEAGQPGLGVSVLTSDPIMELVYQSGVLPLKDLRSVMLCLDSKEVTAIAESHARKRIQSVAASLVDLLAGSEVFVQRIRTLVFDLENRMAMLEVPMWAVHPSLDTPLVLGQLAPMALYDELMGVGHALRLITHPAAWGQVYPNLWDTVAASASLSMRPCLALILGAIIPVEARLSYVTLRHNAYMHDSKGASCLGDMVTRILVKMMTYDYGLKDLHNVTKQLRQVGPALAPFTLFLMRAVRAPPADRRLDQRAADKRALRAQLEAFMVQEGDAVLYCRKVWTRLLLDLDLHFLVSFYIKFLSDGFQ